MPEEKIPLEERLRRLGEESNIEDIPNVFDIDIIDLMDADELNRLYHDQENQSIEKRFEIVQNCLAYANLGKNDRYIIARAKQALYILSKLEELGDESIKKDIRYYRAAARNILPSNEETIRAEFQDLFYCREKDLLSNFKGYNIHHIAKALAYYSSKFIEEGISPSDDKFADKIAEKIRSVYELKPETDLERFNSLVLETAKTVQKVVLNKSLYD